MNIEMSVAVKIVIRIFNITVYDSLTKACA
jgi:hypothetical protein